MIDSWLGGIKVTRADVVAEARTWIGVPYVHQGTSRHGVDCRGLVIVVARGLGVVSSDFDVNGYTRQPDGKTLLALCDRFMTRITMSQLQPGHVLAFAFEKFPAHLGIVGDYKHGGLSIIQARGHCDGRGKVVECRHDPSRRGFIPIQAYAMPGVA